MKGRIQIEYCRDPISRMIQRRSLLWKCHSELISMCNKKKSLRLVSFRRCVRATHTTHIKRWKIYIAWINSRNKKPLWKNFRNRWAVRLPYTFVVVLKHKICIHTCVYSISLSVSHFTSISHSLCFSLWLLFYGYVWVFALVVIEFYRNIYIPCFVALQKYDYKNDQTTVYDIAECWNMGREKSNSIPRIQNQLDGICVLVCGSVCTKRQTTTFISLVCVLNAIHMNVQIAFLVATNPYHIAYTLYGLARRQEI